MAGTTTSNGPTWYLDGRPLDACHEDHADEYAIDCPEGCGREALAWRSRPVTSEAAGDAPAGLEAACGSSCRGAAR